MYGKLRSFGSHMQKSLWFKIFNKIDKKNEKQLKIFIRRSGNLYVFRVEKDF